MPTPRTRPWSASLTVLLMAALALTGCQARDRAGGTADIEARQLRFAVSGDPGPTLTAWANEVDQLSKGTLEITFVRDMRLGQSDYEAGTIADVRAGVVDLASVGVRAFDQVGLTSFQPLLAPLLIDSLELEEQGLRRRHPSAAAPEREHDRSGRHRRLARTHPKDPRRQQTLHRTRRLQRSNRRHPGLRCRHPDVPGPRRHREIGIVRRQTRRPRRLRPAAFLDPGQPLRREAKYVTGNLSLWPGQW